MRWCTPCARPESAGRSSLESQRQVSFAVGAREHVRMQPTAISMRAFPSPTRCVSTSAGSRRWISPPLELRCGMASMTARTSSTSRLMRKMGARPRSVRACAAERVVAPPPITRPANEPEEAGCNGYAADASEGMGVGRLECCVFKALRRAFLTPRTGKGI